VVLKGHEKSTANLEGRFKLRLSLEGAQGYQKANGFLRDEMGLSHFEVSPKGGLRGKKLDSTSFSIEESLWRSSPEAGQSLHLRQELRSS